MAAWPDPLEAQRRVEHITIPESTWGVELADLGVSARARNALEKWGITRTDELNGKTWSHLLRMRNMGCKSLDELRVLVSKLNVTPDLNPPSAFRASDVAWLIAQVERALARLTPIHSEILLLRLGRSGGRCVEPSKVAAQFNVTGSRVHEAVAEAIAGVLKLGGPALADKLTGLARWCSQEDGPGPLTPALLTRWVVEHDDQIRLPALVYVRLLARLHPALPTRTPRGKA